MYIVSIWHRKLTIAALMSAALLLVLMMAASAGVEAVSPAVVSVSASNSTSVALMDDGTVWAWGYNGVSADWVVPQKIDIGQVKQISAGDSHIIALKNDGTVWAWGSNAHGQLGDGTHADSLEPVQVKDLTGVTAVAAGNDLSLALKNDGTVWAWGYNAYGQLGNGSKDMAGSSVPIQVNGLSNVKAISAGGYHCLALQSNGAVLAWGENSHGTIGDGTNESRFTPAASKIKNVSAFDAGEGFHVLAVKSDGNVWAWGYDFRGQLGTGGTSPANQGKDSISAGVDNYNPDIVRGISDVKSVSAGGAFSVALKNDGTVWAWGFNKNGQLGLGTSGDSDVTSPEQVPGLTGITAISAGMYHTLALKSDGTVWAWGSSADGQIGNNSASSTLSPVLVLMGSQVLASASTGPVVPTTPPASVTPSPSAAGGINFLLIGAAGLLIVIAAAVAAGMVVLMKKWKK